MPSPAGVVGAWIDDARNPALLERVGAGVGPAGRWNHTGIEIFGEDLGGGGARKEYRCSKGEHEFHSLDR